MYAPCIFLGAVVSILAAAVVGHNAAMAMICMAVSVMPETGSFAIPFGLVAALNKRAEAEGKPVSTALQMSLLNCCVTVGQQICTMTLAGIEAKLSLAEALPWIFFVAAAAQALGGAGASLLDDSSPGDEQQSQQEENATNYGQQEEQQC